MKKLLLLIAAVAMMLPSCKKINEELDALGNRIDKLEQEAIPSIDEQIAAINTTLSNLDAMDKELKSYIDHLTATASNLQEQINGVNTKIGEVKVELKGDIASTNSELKGEIATAKADVLAQLEALETELKTELAQINATIATLQAKDAELDGKITELRTYVDTELGKTTDWVSATFATLEQYNALASEVATIKEQIKAINESITNLETKLTTKINEDIATAVSTLSADIQQKVSEITTAYTNAIKSAKEEITAAYTVAIQTAISNLDSSLKAWVGEQLANYYTIAQIDAKLAALSAEFEGKLSTQKIYLESLISSLSQTLTNKIASNGELIEGLRNSFTSLSAEVAKNAEAIADNAEKIAANATLISKNAQDIVANGNNIDANQEAITANAALSAENKQLIADVDAKIDGTSNAANTKAIADNAKAIANNAELIAQNSLAISNNAAAIAQNAADIAQLQQNLATTKTEITEAYQKAIEEVVNETNGLINSKFDTVNNRIDSEVNTINNAINALTARVTTLENEVAAIKQQIAKILSDIADMKEDIANLLARIQSVSYVPKYSDGNATMDYGTKTAEFDFLISPKSAVAELAKVWNSALSVKAVYTQTRAVEFINLPITEFVADNNNGVISIKVSGTNLSNAFYTDQQDAKAMLQISDGNSSLTSEYISMLPNYNIRFKDEYVKAICVANWDTNGDGELSYDEAAAVTDIGGLFSSFIMADNNGSLEYIGNQSIRSFDELQYFTGITKLTSKAFSYDINLTSVVLPTNLTEISDGNCEYVPDRFDKTGYVYYGTFSRTNINHIDIPNSVTKIGSYAFYNCSNLKYISVGNSVASIGSNAFSNCSNLKSISIGNSVNSIGSNAFSKCTGELIINNALVETDYYSSSYPTYNGGWLNGSKFTKLTIGDNVTKIGSYTFYGYSSLEEVDISNGAYSIGNYAFSACSSLANIFIPSSVTTIGSYCFNKCSALTNIKLSEGVYSIGEYAFNECSNLTDIVIPDSVTSIGTYCFYRCSNLTTVTIGKDIATINSYAFRDCSKLKNIYCKALIPPVANNEIFLSCSSLSLIYVPKESVADYRAATGWSIYASKIVGYDFE